MEKKKRSIKVLLAFLLLGLMILPSNIKAMVMRVVEAPTIIEMKQDEINPKIIRFKLVYPETQKNVLEHYREGNINDPLELEAEININKTGWFPCNEIDNPKKLSEDNFFTWTSNVEFKNSYVEFRVRIKDNVGDYLTSIWSNEYAVNTEIIVPDVAKDEEVPTEWKPVETTGVTLEEKTCLFNSDLCCKAFIGISLCIWIMIAVFLVSIIIFLLLFKGNKKRVKA